MCDADSNEIPEGLPKVSEPSPLLRRKADGGALCWIARRGEQFWDFIDRRQVDAWGVLVFSLWMTAEILEWCMGFATANHSDDGIKIAAVVASILTPWATMQTFLIKLHFDARKSDFLPKP